MSVPIKKWKGTKSRIEKLLTNYPELRDDLDQTIATVWWNDLKSKHGGEELRSFTAIQFLALIKSGSITPSETIRRTWQKVQQTRPDLRGLKYNERHNIGNEVTQEIVKQ